MNISNLVYLLFRMAPFIIVSYFALQSVFNQDLRGIVYLVGLVLASVITYMFGNMIPDSMKGNASILEDKMAKMKCTTLTLQRDEPLSRLPLSQTVFGYTLAYLTYFIARNNLVTQNIATFVVLPLVTLADLYWNTSEKCSQPPHLVLALIIGGSVGTLWAMFIEVNANNLGFFSGVDNQAVCSMPSRSVVRCRTVGNKK